MTESRVIGRYLLCDAIASGGMATVHLGRLLGPVGFSRTVAIKRLHPHFARDPEFVAMFLDEARLAARIRHPNVVSTIDVVVLQGELFVVMDYVHGEALSRLMRTGPISPALATSIMSGVLYGLHAAHEARTDDDTPLHIVHRDVSPQNILVGIDGIARVVDFGVAKAVGRLQTTREGALKGKISYMSPEQISSDNVDRRTDVYAASVVLWEMLAGRRLFQGDNEVRVLQQVLDGKIEPPSKHAPVPRELDALVMRGLEKKAEKRFATAHEMAEALQAIAFATPGQVGTWVRAVGGKVIDERTRKVAEVESSPDGDEETIALDSRLVAPSVAPPIDSQVSALNVESSTGRRARLSRIWLIGALGVAAFAAGAVIFLVVHRNASEPAANATPRSETAAPPASITPLVMETSVAPLTLPTPSASASTTAKPVVRQTGAPSKCNPPYTMKDGIRIPKMECL